MLSTEKLQRARLLVRVVFGFTGFMSIRIYIYTYAYAYAYAYACMPGRWIESRPGGPCCLCLLVVVFSPVLCSTSSPHTDFRVSSVGIGRLWAVFEFQGLRSRAQGFGDFARLRLFRAWGLVSGASKGGMKVGGVIPK